MKIKCFSKRKLNVRISKTKIECVILGFSQNCCILGKSRKNWSKFSKMQQISDKFCKILFKETAKFSAIFNENFEMNEGCKGVHCVDLGESLPTSIYLQNLASIQPRTSPLKFR